MTIETDDIGAEQHPAADRENAGSKPLVRPDPVVRVDSLAYVMFQRPELEKQLAFLQDFGMQPAEISESAIYLRGHGEAPWFYSAHRGSKACFIGAGYNVSTEEDLSLLHGPLALASNPVMGRAEGNAQELLIPTVLLSM